MGLDQTAFLKSGDNEPVEITYWRKHPNLQGWMERLYRSKGGTEKDFNCVAVDLTLTDITRLMQDVVMNALPPTEGFFFGGDSDDHYKAQDLEFCNKAIKEILAGNEVFYTSWW
jgi:hypothetical protein